MPVRQPHRMLFAGCYRATAPVSIRPLPLETDMREITYCLLLIVPMLSLQMHRLQPLLVDDSTPCATSQGVDLRAELNCMSSYATCRRALQIRCQ